MTITKQYISSIKYRITPLFDIIGLNKIYVKKVIVYNKKIKISTIYKVIYYSFLSTTNSIIKNITRKITSSTAVIRYNVNGVLFFEKVYKTATTVGYQNYVKRYIFTNVVVNKSFSFPIYFSNYCLFTAFTDIIGKRIKNIVDYDVIYQQVNYTRYDYDIYQFRNIQQKTSNININNAVVIVNFQTSDLFYYRKIINKIIQHFVVNRFEFAYLNNFYIRFFYKKQRPIFISVFLVNISKINRFYTRLVNNKKVWNVYNFTTLDSSYINKSYNLFIKILKETTSIKSRYMIVNLYRRSNYIRLLLNRYTAVGLNNIRTFMVKKQYKKYSIYQINQLNSGNYTIYSMLDRLLLFIILNKFSINNIQVLRNVRVYNQNKIEKINIEKTRLKLPKTLLKNINLNNDGLYRKLTKQVHSVILTRFLNINITAVKVKTLVVNTLNFRLIGRYIRLNKYRLPVLSNTITKHINVYQQNQIINYFFKHNYWLFKIKKVGC